jgi:hypothetical protein
LTDAEPLREGASRESEALADGGDAVRQAVEPVNRPAACPAPKHHRWDLIEIAEVLFGPTPPAP